MNYSSLVFLISLVPATFGYASENNKTMYGLYGKRTQVCFNTPRGIECEGESADTLLITPLALSKYARIDLNLIFHNGHTCIVNNAVGSWQENDLVVELRDLTTCKFRITFSSKSAILHDDKDMPCRRQICGARGNLNGIILPLKGAL